MATDRAATPDQHQGGFSLETGPRSLVMSQLQTWLGPVASSSGLWYAGCRRWLRRSAGRDLAARRLMAPRARRPPRGWQGYARRGRPAGHRGFLLTL
jgi:hypothetical protein